MDAREFRYEPRDFTRARTLIFALAGISLADGKQDLVYSRLSRRARAMRLDSIKDYLDHIEPQPRESVDVQDFINALTTNLTAFFRESHHFDHLREFLRRPSAPATQLIWCSAASTGEEPYSIAIAACEAFQSERPPVRVICTDIDTQALEQGRLGVYADQRIQGLDAARQRRFFLRGNGPNQGKVRVKPHLQALLEFQPWNLLSEATPPWRDCDVIFCRNVMIYFDKPTQLKVLTTLCRALKPEGVMYAGHSESFFHAAHLFRNLGRTIYVPAVAQALSA